MLTPSGVAHVCPRGRLMLTCSTDANLMQWSVTVPRYPGTSQTRGLQYSGTAQRATPIVIGPSTFNISKTLNESLSRPLISTMVADVVTDINGTVINCSEYIENGMNTVTTKVHVFEIHGNINS